MSASELNYAPLDVKLQRRLRPNSNDKVNLVSREDAGGDRDGGKTK